MTMLEAFAFVVYFALLVCSRYVHVPNNLVVETDCGPVQGTNPNGTGYSFKGIPYAIPPIHDLRWTPPLPLSRSSSTCWNGTFQATAFGNTCFQKNPDNPSQLIGSEDCLYLNVWTPTLNKTANLPVMVWIHGGSLQLSNGNWPTYCPSAELAYSTNVVYVSMNYRLHAFGFMALDILSKNSPNKVSGNYGFMDQQLALRWVQSNIRNFGGNPNLVTIFGQSSGGTSIIGLLASPLSKGLFHRAWMMSASPVYNKSLADASRDNQVFMKNTGCSDLGCLKNLTSEAVINAVPWDVYPNWAMSDQMDLPVNEHFDGAICIVDGLVVPEPPFEAWRNGRGIDVPVIVGTTAQEVDFQPSHADLNAWTWDIYHKYVRTYLDTFPGNITEQALKLYPDGVESAAYQYTTMTTDLRTTCPNNIMTTVLKNSFKSPVYRYVLQQRPTFPVRVVGIPFLAKFSCHMWDSFGFFNTIKDYYTPTNSDEAFVKMMQTEMIHFAINGKPFSTDWGTYPLIAILNSDVSVVMSYHSEMCEFWNKNNFFRYGWIN